MTEPHWERGFRCHGYWYGQERMAIVILPIPPGKVGDEGYSIAVQVPGTTEVELSAPTLNQARKEVERWFGIKLGTLEAKGTTLEAEIEHKRRAWK